MITPEKYAFKIDEHLYLNVDSGASLGMCCGKHMLASSKKYFALHIDSSWLPIDQMFFLLWKLAEAETVIVVSRPQFCYTFTLSKKEWKLYLPAYCLDSPNDVSLGSEVSLIVHANTKDLRWLMQQAGFDYCTH